MKQVITLLLLIRCLSFMYSQNTSSMLTIRNEQLIHSNKSTNRIQLLVKGHVRDIQTLCKKYDARYLYSIGSIHRITIAVNEVDAFARESMIQRIGDVSKGGYRMLDTARIWNNTDSVYMGYAPLTQAYKGDGVVIGIIDDGIYFNHPDFKNADSSTRIKFIWDQNMSASPSSPAPYGYGKEWNYLEINAGNCTHVEQGNAGHGTHVSGIAAGNGNANAAFRGNAPNADIIVVSVKYGVNFLSNVVDAADYIFKKADAMGKPCVINTSIGDYYGSHDGSDITTQAIEALLDERPGRVLVAAAGNAGNIAHHARYQFSGTDTVYSYFKDRAYGTKYYFDFWADTMQFNNAYFSIEAADTGTYAFQGSSGFFSIKRDFPTLPFLGSVLLTRNISNLSGVFRGQAKINTILEGDKYHVEIEITPDSANKYWALKFCGQGRADVWAEKLLLGTSNFVSDSITSLRIGYVMPDVNQTTVSSWQCSDKVITVGNYVAKNAFLNYDSAYTYNTEIAGYKAANSSMGPTRDGRLKPDISAPGNFILSCMNIRWFPALLSTGQSYKIAYGGYYVRNSGTSMASPMVAGAVALLLQKYPNLRAEQAKEILTRTAKKDTITGLYANMLFGNGRLHLFESMKYPAVFGCMDTAAFNYNASANIEDGSCVPKVYGCMDSTALNYNPLANTAHPTDTCIYRSTVGIESVSEHTHFVVYPQPASIEFTFMSLEKIDVATLQIYTSTGAFVLEKTITEFPYTLDVHSWATGMYLYSIQREKGTSNGKISIIK